MRRRDWIGSLIAIGSHVASWLFNRGDRFERPNVPESPPESPTEPAEALKRSGLTFLRGCGFVVAHGHPDETMHFVDVLERLKYRRRVGISTIVTSGLEAVRFETETLDQAICLYEALDHYRGEKRFQWLIKPSKITDGIDALEKAVPSPVPVLYHWRSVT